MHKITRCHITGDRNIAISTSDLIQLYCHVCGVPIDGVWIGNCI
jgi:hypothetical protein